jgi:hypothetical protein
MEKIIYENDNICMSSDTESAYNDNKAIFDFITDFKPSMKENNHPFLLNLLNPFKNEKNGFHGTENHVKEPKINGKSKHSKNNLRKDLDSPYRKVQVTTDLKMDPKVKAKR